MSKVPGAKWREFSKDCMHLRIGSEVKLYILRVKNPNAMSHYYRIGVYNDDRSVAIVPDHIDSMEDAMHIAEILYLTGT